jgi:hypothetical protein
MVKFHEFGIIRPCLSLGNSIQPLVRVDFGGLVTTFGREASCVGCCPSYVDVLCLENDQRWYRGSSGTNALNHHYPLLSFHDDHPAGLLSQIQ